MLTYLLGQHFSGNNLK